MGSCIVQINRSAAVFHEQRLTPPNRRSPGTDLFHSEIGKPQVFEVLDAGFFERLPSTIVWAY